MPDMGLAVSTQKMSSSEESGNPTAFSYLLFSNKTKIFLPAINLWLAGMLALTPTPGEAIYATI